MSDVHRKGRFDRLATAVDEHTSRAWFFACCLAFVGGWFVLGPSMGWADTTYHLLLNSPTTSVTFLLVALSANASRRDRAAAHAKMDALAQGLHDLMDHVSIDCDHQGEPCRIRDDMVALARAVGLEEQVGTVK